MGVLLLIIAVIIFVIADIIIRTVLRRSREKRLRQQREEALEKNLRLDFSHEAKTLKRVEVDKPKARILAVDDEEIILDSFRKILVLEGYSVDTVETGQETLGLIQKHHYDFLFVDLKMPAMNGVDVCKSAKHLRPDIDVIIITGYASVDTAVETMKYGAMDYVQKPFTEEELVDMVNKFVIRRQDRIKKQLSSKVHITHMDETESTDSVEFAIPGGVFISTGHTWAQVIPDGLVHVGLDDFARKIIGRVDNIEMPNLGMEVKRGDLLFSAKQNNTSIPFHAPVSGKVSEINKALLDNPERIQESPYDKNWICKIDASDLDTELSKLKIGQAAVDFYNEDIKSLHDYIKQSVTSTKDDADVPADGHVYLGELEALTEKDINAIISDFFKRTE
ncbi:MAG: response regulator [Caldithrix sp.]|nr:response regulator [Caldithrix sp.]